MVRCPLSDNNLYHSNVAGAVSYDGYELVNFSTRSKPSIVGNKVNFIGDDRQDDVWIATTEGVTRIQNGNESQFSPLVDKQGYWSNHIYMESKPLSSEKFIKKVQLGSGDSCGKCQLK